MLDIAVSDHSHLGGIKKRHSNVQAGHSHCGRPFGTLSGCMLPQLVTLALIRVGHQHQTVCLLPAAIVSFLISERSSSRSMQVCGAHASHQQMHSTRQLSLGIQLTPTKGMEYAAGKPTAEAKGCPCGLPGDLSAACPRARCLTPGI